MGCRGITKHRIKTWEQGKVVPTQEQMVRLEQFIMSHPDPYSLIVKEEFIRLLHRLAIRQKQKSKQPDNHETWDQHILRVRQAKNLSRTQAAQEMGILRQNLKEWDKGRTPDFRPRIVAFLGYVPLFVLEKNRTIGKRLRVIRQLYGITLKEMAPILGVSVPALEHWESGKRQENTVIAHPQVQALLRGEIDLG